MRVTSTEENQLHIVPANRRTYPVLAADQALTRAEVIAARTADVAPKHSVALRAA